MSTINGIIKVHAVMLLVLLIIGCSNVQTTSDVEMLFIKCNGQLSYVNKDKELELKKLSLGDVARGILIKGEFLYFDELTLVATDIITGKSRSVINLTGKIGKELNLWQVGHISENYYYFSAQKYEKNVPINEQKNLSTIYKTNKVSGETSVVVANCSSPYFSGYGDKIYYVDEIGSIRHFDNGEISNPIAKGDVPTVSPNGEKLAFSSFGLVNNKVYVYDLKSNASDSVADFFGPNSMYPIIRWSSNGVRVAVKSRSDISVGSIYVIDTKDNKEAFSFKNKSACNWFFVDDLKVN